MIYNDIILVAAALDANPTAAINAPIIVTTLHPNRFVKELAMGPAPSVTPTNIDGMKDTDARLVPSKPFINATTNIPKEYVIPSAIIEITLSCDSISIDISIKEYYDTRRFMLLRSTHQ